MFHYRKFQLLAGDMLNRREGSSRQTIIYNRYCEINKSLSLYVTLCKNIAKTARPNYLILILSNEGSRKLVNLY